MPMSGKLRAGAPTTVMRSPGFNESRVHPRRIKVCVLLEKAARRVEKVRADYIAFSIPDLFVVGYGLDFSERYRNLPFVGVLHPDIYNVKSEA